MEWLFELVVFITKSIARDIVFSEDIFMGVFVPFDFKYKTSMFNYSFPSPMSD